MLKLTKNKKLLLALIVVLVVAGGIFVLGAHQAKAGWFTELIGLTFQGLAQIISGLTYIIFYIFGKLVWLAAQLLQGALTISNFKDVPLVNNGWQVTRGLANMFFALILLIMSIATILRIESFGAKKVLPRLIIAALLINFSLLFGGVIIDFSQILTSYFIDAAKGASPNISERLMDGLQIAKQYAVPTNMDEQIGDILAKGTSGMLSLIMSLVFGTIIMLVVAFTFLAATIFLIFRVVALWLLLIFAPLAWVSLAAPAGQAGGLWGQWWSNFIKWAFFAPIYAFFIYLGSMAIGGGAETQNTFTQAFQNTQGLVLNNGIMSGFLAGGMSMMLQYVALIIIFLGGLFVAQKFGVYGAGAVMNVGKRAGKAAGKWTAKKGTGYEKLSPVVVSAAGSVAAKFGFTKTGGALKGKSVEMKEKQLEQRTDKLYNKYLNKLPDKDVLEKTEEGGSRERLQAMKVAKDRGLLNKDDRATRDKATKTIAEFKAYGFTKEAREIEEAMPDVVENEEERKEAVKRAVANGTDKRWNKAVFEHPKYGQEIIGEMSQLKSPKDMTDTIKGYAKPTQDSANNALKMHIDGDFEKKSDQSFRDASLGLRITYANTSGKLAEAFSVPKNSSPEVKKVAEAAAISHIQSMKPAQIGDVKDDDEESLRLVGAHLSQGIIASIRHELNQKQKDGLRDGAKKAGRIEIIRFMDNSPAWGGRQRGQAQAGPAGPTVIEPPKNPQNIKFRT